MPRIVTIADLRKVLAAKERQVGKLQTQRRKLAGRLAAIDRQIAALGGLVEQPARRRGRPAGRRRARSGKPLVEYIKEALAKAKAGMRVKEVTAVVRKAGYPTASKAFYGLVAAGLRDRKVFRKVRRGVYKLKGRLLGAARKAPSKAGAKKNRRGVTKKARRAGSLTSFLVKVMAGKERVTIREATKAVKAAGYESKAKDFRFIVSKALSRGAQFGRVGRGTYALKS